MSNEKKPVVIVTHDLPDDWITSLKQKARLHIGPQGGEGLEPALKKHLPQVQGLLTLLVDPVGEELLAQAPELRVISNMAVGVDNIDLEACTARGIPVGNTPGILTAGTADLTLALLLAVARKLPQAQADARAGRWTTWNPTGWLGADLKGATIGIVGLGKIGTAVARRLRPFGPRLIFHNRSPKPDLERELNAEQVSFSRLLQESDFIALHVPLTEETYHMVDRDALETMKPSAILINMARGQVVDTQALLHALREKKIRAAGLDVTHPEPLPPDHPLYELDNCLITPHIGSATHNTRQKMAHLACDNLIAGLEGRELPHCVNPEVYRD